MRALSAARGLVASLALMASAHAYGQRQEQQYEWSGYLSLEPRLFLERPAFEEQPARGLSWSVVLAPEFRYEWGGGDHRLTIEPLVRIDQHDSERTHTDLREASWLHMNGPWMLRAGLSRVFWGVTESRHLVDIINQTDFVEDIDGEAKLGQPMVHLERWTSRGTFGVFLLPGFRERTFPAGDARLRGPLPIAGERAEYESGAEDRRLDAALRWSHVAGAWDVGLSAFHGTSREPRLVLAPEETSGAVLVPHYDVITQLAADVQHTGTTWLWKLETILRSGHDRSFAALVGGFEYTLFGVAGGAIDVGLLGEVLYDGRGPEAPPAIYGDGLFAGVRVALNDPGSTMLLAGVLADRNGGGTFTVIEAERRVGERWRLQLQARLFSGIDRAEPFLSGLRNDSYVDMRMARYC